MKFLLIALAFIGPAAQALEINLTAGEKKTITLDGNDLQLSCQAQASGLGQSKCIIRKVKADQNVGKKQESCSHESFVIVNPTKGGNMVNERCYDDMREVQAALKELSNKIVCL